MYIVSRDLNSSQCEKWNRQTEFKFRASRLPSTLHRFPNEKHEPICFISFTAYILSNSVERQKPISEKEKMMNSKM